MYFFMFLVCVNTIKSMINTNPFFDLFDFQAMSAPGPLVERVRSEWPGVVVLFCVSFVSKYRWTN